MSYFPLDNYLPILLCFSSWRITFARCTSPGHPSAPPEKPPSAPGYSMCAPTKAFQRGPPAMSYRSVHQSTGRWARAIEAGISNHVWST
jgi:hypothetical protein